MGLLTRVSYHLRYLSHAAGRRVRFGSRRFRMHGYFPNKFHSGRMTEPYLEGLIATLLREREGAFIDIGTNVGQTLAKVLAADPDRQYVGFEPQVACAFYIDEFLRTNGIESAQILPVGLGEKPGFLTLHAGRQADDMASMDEISARAQENGRKRVLPVVRGDDAIAGLGISRIAVIKIDVEGAELLVLRGLEATLRSKRPALLFEVLPNFSGVARRPIDPVIATARRERAATLFTFLADLGYRIYPAEKTGSLALSAFELDDREKWPGSDYLAMIDSAL